MIENKKLGLKIAKNKYEEIEERLKQEISDTEISLELNKVLVEYLKKKNGQNRNRR